MSDEYKTYEAIEWLNDNNNPSAFASNRFGETVNAIEFVETLYKAGAVEVRVVDVLDEPERLEEEGGAYASTLLVQLPKDNEKREAVLEIYKNEIEQHGIYEGEEFQGYNEDIIAFWWD